MKKKWMIIGLMVMGLSSTVLAEGNRMSEGKTVAESPAKAENAATAEQTMTENVAATVEQALAEKSTVAENQALAQDVTQGSGSTQGKEVKAVKKATLDEANIVSVNYKNKIFADGEYKDLSAENYKVYSKDNTVYLPMRLLTKLISTTEEQWEASWDKKKPDQVILTCEYMEPYGSGGSLSTGKRRIIELTVGSTKVVNKIKEGSTVNKTSITLTKVPRRFGNTIALPLRAIGQLLGKQVNYAEGLVVISRNGINAKDAETIKALKTVKKNLENKQNYIEMVNEPVGVTNYNGVAYYALKNYEKQNEPLVLYSRKSGGKPQVVKTIDKAEGVNPVFINNQFYYYVKNKSGESVYSYDLATKKTNLVWDIGNKKEWDYISNIICKEHEVYFVTHSGDLTIGNETIYKIANKKGTKLTDAHFFANIFIEGNKVYYTDVDCMESSGGLNVYDETTKQTTAVGPEDYVYDMGECRAPYWIYDHTIIKDNKLYSLGHKENTSEKIALCCIDLTTNEQKVITTPTTQYWLNGDHIYYVETATGFIKTVDLMGNGEKTVVNVPVEQVELKNNCLYYTQKKDKGWMGHGLYVYGLGTGETTMISDKLIQDFKATGNRVIYRANGYEPGLYKWENKKNTLLEGRILSETTLGEGSALYNLMYEKGEFAVLY